MKNFLCALVFLCTSASLAQCQTTDFWLRYPAISPDGNSVVFNHKGDIYKVPSTGGTAIPLTISSAYDYGAVWSHDGEKIAFASDRYGNMDVFVMPAQGGEAKRLTYHSFGERPSCFSADNSHVIFSGLRQDLATHVQFPSGVMPELYTVPITGGRVDLLLTTPALDVALNSDGSKWIFHDRKGYENKWRKHHTSAVTRDIWMYDVSKKEYLQLSEYEGEDRNPVFHSNDDDFYYLSESSGSFNVHKSSLSQPDQNIQITDFKNHPVRFLSISDNNTLSFGYDGGLFTLIEGESPKQIDVKFNYDGRSDIDEVIKVNDNFTEASVSPNGKEFVYIFRGEIFVSSIEEGATKRITNTPWQERSVSFSPDGRSLLFAAEVDNSWNIYQISIHRKEEPYFFQSTLLDQETIIATSSEEFQPAYSPDGKEVAYLHDRTELKVINLESKDSRSILSGDYNYSYSDGDQWYQWSPDSKWFLVSFGQKERIFWPEVGLIKADGNGALTNLTKSGYADFGPKWGPEGKSIYWGSTRQGNRTENGFISQSDVFAMYLSQMEWDEAFYSSEEMKILKELRKKKKEDEKKANNKKKGDNKDEDEEKDEPVEPIVVDWEGLEDRKKRLTGHTSNLRDWLLSKDGEKLYYITRFEGKNDLWVTDLRKKETKKFSDLNGSRVSMEMNEKGEFIFVLSDGKPYKIDLKEGKKKSIPTKGEMVLKSHAERAYIFDHAWRQVREKFYVVDLHNVDWDFYYKSYRRFLPEINNNYDFTEMLSEMLGELNASHTGSGYRNRKNGGDETSSLGLLYDYQYKGDGLKIAEVIDKGPCRKANSKIKAGNIIEKIDGQVVSRDIDFYQLLNRKKDHLVLLSLYDKKTNKRWEEVVKPISLRDEIQLLYDRWVKSRRAEVERLSGGRLGYVHVRGMNDPSMRVVIEDALGKHLSAEALIVDTRFNGGGNLHDVLADFLNGKKYMDIIPHGQNIGSQPWSKWNKPSIVVMGESNYSDAHLFPVAYKIKGVGQTLGMPVPGTGTFVWWETQIDPTIYFGIPMGGWKPIGQPFLENSQLEPDIRVQNEPSMMTTGRDQQLEKAVEVLLSK